MTDEQKAEIERLAGAHHDAAVKLRSLGMMNIGFTAERRRANAIAYALAEAEEHEARQALDRVVRPLPQFDAAAKRIDAIFSAPITHQWPLYVPPKHL